MIISCRLVLSTCSAAILLCVASGQSFEGVKLGPLATIVLVLIFLLWATAALGFLCVIIRVIAYFMGFRGEVQSKSGIRGNSSMEKRKHAKTIDDELA